MTGGEVVVGAVVGGTVTGGTVVGGAVVGGAVTGGAVAGGAVVGGRAAGGVVVRGPAVGLVLAGPFAGGAASFGLAAVDGVPSPGAAWLVGVVDSPAAASGPEVVSIPLGSVSPNASVDGGASLVSRGVAVPTTGSAVVVVVNLSGTSGRIVLGSGSRGARGGKVVASPVASMVIAEGSSRVRAIVTHADVPTVRATPIPSAARHGEGWWIVAMP